MRVNGTVLCMVWACASAASVPVKADTLHIQERVINSAQPGAPQVPFPLSKIASYSNAIGFTTDCTVATQYDGHDGAAFWTIPNIHARCTQGPAYDPPLMHRVKYPISVEPANPRPGMLFSRPGHWTTNIPQGFATYWNRLYSTNQPGWVYVDPANGRYLQFAIMVPHELDSADVGIYPTYDTKLYYRVSLDGGASFTQGDQFRPVVAAGHTEFHPFPNMYVGQNGGTVPGVAFVHRTANGDVLATMTITEGAPPLHVSSITSGYVLRGKWNAAGTDVTWTVSQPASLPSQYSTRGVDEPAVLELSSATTGAVNCILIGRASNEYWPGSLPGYEWTMAGHHWLFRSKDGCATWDGAPIRFGYSDGTQFFAPAANSTLFRSPQNGRVYWIGAISAANSQGNWPRTKLIAAEVDLQSATPGIVKDTTVILDEMYGLDTDLIHLNNAQLAMQPDGTAFVYFDRPDFGCANCTVQTSWYSLVVAQQTGLTLNVTTSGLSSHGLSWQANGASVSKYHVRRRYLSGAPLTDLWQELGTIPGTSTTTTISGYETWQEAEYELVADLTSGGSTKSNRVITRFPSWTGPRLSFSFPTETAAGDAPPLGSVYVQWSYDQPTAITGFRFYRRYFNDNGTATAWAVMGDVNSSLRGVTLSGYSLGDRFELRVNALAQNGTEIPSNVIFVRFPQKSDPLRRPY